MKKARRRKASSIPIKRRKRRTVSKSKNRSAKPDKPQAAIIPYQDGYQIGHQEGYSKGYEDGSKQAEGEKTDHSHGWELAEKAGYEKGLKIGRYEGGDAIIDEQLPETHVLPDTSVAQVIASGIAALGERVVHLLTAEQVAGKLLEALEQRKPLSVVRLGDGELLTLAQESVLPTEQIRQEGGFLEYAGVKVPDIAARDRLLAAVKRADIVGIPKLRQPNYQRLATAVFQSYGIDFRSKVLTDSLVNYRLFQDGHLSRLMKGRRVLVVGNLAQPLAKVLAESGVVVAGAVEQVQGIHDVDRVMGEIRGQNFDLALVSAGIAAVILADAIAAEMGKAALDFGHMANSIIKGEAPIQA
ncbi:GT-D fold domain-containing glycosyltransferase [Paenibacillus algorifonticola]|uniref:GT-D fold domain-containing protein n=1 Tax=Paenibacillus algorifonticola TaxID=684063 RepID=UPI003D2D8D6A